MKKNNKGFTLIELLITIIMLLLLTILVVVSFVKISDEKKIEADKITERQIENAAEQFFSSEYYWVNYLKKEPTAEVYVNVAKLVEDDYLNVISKTSTEKKYNSCDIVKLSYVDGKIKYKYEPAKDGVTECNPILKYASDLDIEIIPVNYKKGNSIKGKQWYIEKDILLNIKITSKVKDELNKITEVKFLYQDENTSAKLINDGDYEKIYEFTFKENGLNNLKVFATNAGGVENNQSEISLYLDKEVPTIDSKAYTYKKDFSGFKKFSYFKTEDFMKSNSWVNLNSSKNKIYFSSNASDLISGINTEKASCKLNGKKSSFNTNGNSKEYSLYNKYINDGIYNIDCSFEDIAGNKNTSQYIIKKDTSKPTCSLKVVGNVKVVNKDAKGKFILKDNTFDIKTEKKTNYSGWYSDNKIIVSFKEKKDTMGEISKFGLATSKNYNSKSSDIHSYETSNTTWYGYIMDEAGNENTCKISLKNDYTAPTLLKTGAGSVRCLKKDSKQYNAFGYSIKFKDNLSGATVRMTKYYSHWSCDDGKFNWATSTLQASSTGSNERIYTAFAGCSNNPSPAAKYILIDKAGNVYNDGKEINLTIKSTSQKESKKECDESKWYNVHPNVK